MPPPPSQQSSLTLCSMSVSHNSFPRHLITKVTSAPMQYQEPFISLTQSPLIRNISQTLLYYFAKCSSNWCRVIFKLGSQMIAAYMWIVLENRCYFPAASDESLVTEAGCNVMIWWSEVTILLLLVFCINPPSLCEVGTSLCVVH